MITPGCYLCSDKATPPSAKGQPFVCDDCRVRCGLEEITQVGAVTSGSPVADLSMPGFLGTLVGMD